MSYYITGLSGMRYRLLAGPYKTHAAAMADVDRAMESAATYHDGAFNEVSVELITDFNQPAALNLRGFFSAA